MSLRVSGVGNIVNDPKTRDLANSRKQILFRLASNEGWGDNRRADFYDVCVFVSGESKLAQYLNKGLQIWISGHWKTRTVEEATGGRRTYNDVVVNHPRDLKILTPKGQNTQTAVPQTMEQPVQQAASPVTQGFVPPQPPNMGATSEPPGGEVTPPPPPEDYGF